MNVSPKNLKKILLVSLFAFLAFSRLWRLGEPSSYYFDEVYHAFTAQAYAQNDARAYEWWHEAPEGFAYEWLHPPLGKLFQAGSIKLLGDTPFSWRLPGAIFGFLTGVLLYLIGKDIFKSAKIGILALMFWTFDGLSLTMSRITMNDVFLTFWALLAFYLFLTKRPLWQVGIGLGLAAATKWSGLFAIALIAGLWFWQNRKISFKQAVLAVYSFLFLPAAIYLLSYTQFFLQGHTLEQFFGLHSQTWWYQTNLDATHPYSSAPYQWPFGSKALFAYTDGGGKNIYLSGNPVLWWAGLAAVIGAIWKFKSLGFKLRATLFAYFIMFLPWAASPRILFIYHYLPALAFLFLLLAWNLEKIWRGRKLPVTGYLLLVALVFMLYYPLWTALPTPSWWSNLLIP